MPKENKHENVLVQCSNCNNAWDSAFEVTNSTEDPQLGDLFLCPKCGTVNALTLLGWKEASDNDWKSLTRGESKDLHDAMVRIQYDNLMRQHETKVLDGRIIPG